MKSFEYYSPDSIKEASDLLLEFGDDASILNGGTDLIVRMRDFLTTPKLVIDIKNIKELHNISYVENKGVFIGACVNLNEIGNHEIIKEKLSFFAQAALSVGSKQVRNRATCIGNLCNASPLADTATPLMAMNAVVHIHGSEGVREIPIKELFVFVRKTSLLTGDIVTGITIPMDKNVKGIFTKISRRKEVDLSTVCSTVIKVEDEYRISYGAVAPTPIRMPITEAYLKGKKLSEAIISQACEIAAKEVSPIDDIRASKEYRVEMVKLILRDILNEWL